MKIIAFSYRFADHIVGVSKGVAERVLTVPGVRKERVSVIYNPSYLPEMEKAGEQEAPHPWLKDKTAPVVLGVGRLVPQKDFPTLIKAIHEVSQRRDVRLLIIGEGEDRAMLEAMIRERNLEEKVCLLGFQEKPWVYMAHTPVFCLSSTYEGFGNVVVEALACGTQVVSTDCPFGPAEILDYGRYGRLVPVGDASAMAKAIEGAIDQPIDREVLLGRAREFSVAHAANIYLGLAQTGR